MAFRVQEPSRRKISLMGLIDVIFLLLVFFLVVNVVGINQFEEKQVTMRTPDKEAGEAEVLIQIVEDGSYVYLDDRVFEDFTKKIQDENWTLRGSDPGRHLVEWSEAYGEKVAQRDKRLDHDAVVAKLRARVRQARESNENATAPGGDGRLEMLYVLVRCPPEEEYGRVVDLLNVIVDEKGEDDKINYGVSGGVLGDLVERAVYRMTRDGMTIVFRGSES